MIVSPKDFTTLQPWVRSFSENMKEKEALEKVGEGSGNYKKKVGNTTPESGFEKLLDKKLKVGSVIVSKSAESSELGLGNKHYYHQDLGEMAEVGLQKSRSDQALANAYCVKTCYFTCFHVHCTCECCTRLPLAQSASVLGSCAFGTCTKP